MTKETVKELGDRFLKRFEKLQPTIHLSDETSLFCSLKLHELFRVFRRPIPVLLSSNESIEHAFARDPDWLDKYVGDSIAIDIAHRGLVLFVLGPAGNELRVKRLLSNQMFGVGQPIIPASAFFARNKNPIDSIRDAILQYVPTRHFSPYQINQVAADDMFVGRNQLLNNLHSARGSHIIVGPRRIGKSSLVRHLQNLLGNLEHVASDQERMPRCSYTDVSEFGEDMSRQIWRLVLQHFNLERKDFAAGGRVVKLIGGTRKDDRSAPVDEAQALSNLIRQFPGQLTIILDEVDKWIESEASLRWPTLGRLRAMTDDGKAQVLLIGYESLALAADNDLFPFAGRGTKVRLGPLELPEVEQLVTEPLEELGLRFVGKDQIISLIWTVTSGMPQIVQDICAHIVELAFQDKGERTVTMTVLRAAIDASATARVFRHPLMNCPVPLASAIAGALSVGLDGDALGEGGKQSPKKYISLTIDEITTVLEEQGYTYDSRDFERALAYLELRWIIEAIDTARTRWKWTNDIARGTMQQMIENTGRQRWLQSTLAQHREGSWRTRYRALENGIV